MAKVGEFILVSMHNRDTARALFYGSAGWAPVECVTTLNVTGFPSREVAEDVAKQLMEKHAAPALSPSLGAKHRIEIHEVVVSTQIESVVSSDVKFSVERVR